jgi:hypothetical protein
MPDEVKVTEGLRESSIEEIVPFQYTITSYGADYPVDGLVKRMKEGNIYVPSFQRRFVWPLKTSSRFIESLLLGLPVPGIFLWRDEDTKKLVIIDGQQRLQTLLYFYEGIFHNTGKEFSLYKCESQYEGITYKSLTEEDRRRLNDSIIHATIVRQDEPSDDYSSIFHIFERLNTASITLTNQEIRNALYHGEFNDFIIELNNTPHWRALWGKPSNRFRDVELILRFFALYYDGDQYKPTMKSFLNLFIGRNRHCQLHTQEQMIPIFLSTTTKIHDFLGNDAFKPRGILVAAVCDSIMVGVAKRLKKGDIRDDKVMQSNYKKLLQNTKFIDASSVHTTDEINVRTRIDLAVQAFANIDK